MIPHVPLPTIHPLTHPGLKSHSPNDYHTWRRRKNKAFKFTKFQPPNSLSEVIYTTLLHPSHPTHSYRTKITPQNHTTKAYRTNLTPAPVPHPSKREKRKSHAKLSTLSYPRDVQHCQRRHPTHAKFHLTFSS